MAEEVGALRVSLSADTAQFERDLGKAQATATRLGTAIGTRLGLALGGAAAAFFTAQRAMQTFNQGIEEVSKLANLADRLGITTREMQTLAGAAEQAKVDFSTLEQVATTLGARLQAGLRSPMSDISQSLRALGVDARNADGSFRTFADLLPDLADAFARFADDENKSIVATRLFGEAAGPGMARFLSQGSEAIEEQRRKLDQLLPRLDVQSVRNFEEANTRLQSTIKNLSAEFGQMAAGPAADFINSITQMIAWINNATGRSLPSAARAMEELTISLREFDATQRNLAGDDAWSRIARGVNNVTGSGDAQLAALSRRIQELRAQLAAAVKEDEEAAARAAGRNRQPADNRPSIAVPDPRAIAEMQAQLAATMTALSGQDPTKSIISQYLFGGQEPAVWTTAFSDAMAQIDKVGRASGQTATQISNQKVALMQREQGLITDTATLAASTLTQVFQGNKAAGIAAAVINTAVGITRALQLPPPFSWIQAGLIAASGAAQIATIRSASPGSGATPSVNGGSGSGEALTSQTLFVEGIDPNAQFSGEAVRDLAERLLQYQRDGGQVVIK